MSTENFPYGGWDDGGARFIAFLGVSLVIHAAAAWLAVTWGGALERLTERAIERDKAPIYVDIIKPPIEPSKKGRFFPEVIEVPPDMPATGGPQKEIIRYADRTNIVEKETVPEPAPRTIIVPGSTGHNSPASELSKGGSGGADKGSAAGALDKKADGGILPTTGEGPGIEVKASQESAPTVENGGTPGKDPGVIGGKGPPGIGTETGRPNLLLTEEKLTELAERYERETPKGEKGKTLQLNTTELKYQKYLINLKHRIEFYWEYPVLAVKNGWQGKLNLDFTIRKDGTIVNIELKKSSGYPALDDAAKTALKLAAPFPPFPEDFTIEQINIKGQFEYNLSYAPPPPVR